MNDEIQSIFESTYPEMAATGFRFTEGPLWNQDGFIYFVDIRRNLQFRWSRMTGSQIAREDTGEGNGTTFDKQGGCSCARVVAAASLARKQTANG